MRLLTALVLSLFSYVQNLLIQPGIGLIDPQIFCVLLATPGFNVWRDQQNERLSHMVELIVRPIIFLVLISGNHQTG